MNDFDDLEDAVDYLRMVNIFPSPGRNTDDIEYAIRHRYFGARYTRTKIAELDI